MKHLSPQLMSLTDQAISILGEVIKREWGKKTYLGIENLRKAMRSLRNEDFAKRRLILNNYLRILERLSSEEQRKFATGYTLMLELMNACENAYRSFSIREKQIPLTKKMPDSIIYVLTAHPTEARSTENIFIFHQIQIKLTNILLKSNSAFSKDDHDELFYLIDLAIKISIVRGRKPKVHDEAEHIYSTLLREETLQVLLTANRNLAPVFIRSWVGGDKDGHPGVDKSTFMDSLQLSRRLLLLFVRKRIAAINETLSFVHNSSSQQKLLKTLITNLTKLKIIRAEDGKRIIEFKKLLSEFSNAYNEMFVVNHPALVELDTLMKIFPGIVVPLEFRESSDVLMTFKRSPNIAIAGMLAKLESISKGADPRWYVRGFIISMTKSFAHIQMAAKIMKQKLHGVRLPIVPLFEQAEALQNAPEIIEKMIRDPSLRIARKRYNWRFIEIMVGYSDSSKECGVLASRLEIAESMHQLDRLCARLHTTPIFFQGSGGSVDRGGGSVEEQTAWWPASALRNYKVTIQGEMVERSLSSPEITRRQLERIAVCAGRWKTQPSRKIEQPLILGQFSQRVAESYRTKVHSEEFLQVIERATPYPFLDILKIGSRPVKRKSVLSVEGLRAIPWVLCWTQTRVLFPVWWGIGSAWKQTSLVDRKKLKSIFRQAPVLTEFVHALGITLAKVDLAVWSLYLEQSELTEESKRKTLTEFLAEYESALLFHREITKNVPDLDKFWLLESIYLRSAMIHPLNLLQIISTHESDNALLRLTVTGISSGMMATG